MAIDFGLFKSHLEGNSALGAFLRGHLWIEHCVESALRIHLAKPDALQLDRMSFAQKTALCQALNAFDDPTISAIRAINKFRNGLAHDLSASVSRDDILDLVGRLPASSRGYWNQVTEDLETEWHEVGHIFLFYMSILPLLELRNQIAEYESKYKQEIMTHEFLRVAHEMTVGDVTDEDEERFKRKSKVPPRPTIRDVWINFPQFEKHFGQAADEPPEL